MKDPFNFSNLSVLPSRFALSDLGLSDSGLYLKNALILVLFLREKSAFWPKKSKKSDFHSFSLPNKTNSYLNIFLNIEYFQIKVDLPNVWIKFLEQVWFWPQHSVFGSAFGLMFGRNMVWLKSDFEISWSLFLLGSTAYA